MKVAFYSRKSKYTGKGDSIGKNTNRPEFQKLLNDIKKDKFDILICYRLDRIFRNVADFSSTLDELQAYGVDFVSIREQFDTTRAMIYIASVFAQSERETIAERVIYNMIELAKNGFGWAAFLHLDTQEKKKLHMMKMEMKRLFHF